MRAKTCIAVCHNFESKANKIKHDNLLLCCYLITADKYKDLYVVFFTLGK